MSKKMQRTIKKWRKTGVREPIYLGDAAVFMWPGTDLTHAVNNHYLVTWRRTWVKGKAIDEFECSCPGIWYSGDRDTCPHVRDLAQQIQEAI
jgi:hypothetical protein